jgi:Putative peptidoglycan binding domain
MKRIITLATVLLLGLASVQAAQTDDQSKKKKKKQAQTTSQTTPAATKSATQTSKNRGGTQTSTPHGATQTSNQRVVKKTYVKPGQSNTVATANYNQQNVQRTKKSKDKKAQSNVAANTNYNQQNIQRIKKSKQTNVAANNNAKWNKKTYKQFKRSGNEWSYSAAQRWNWRQRHDRDWWRHSNYRLVRYGGGYWYWNNGWWYPAYGYDPYFSHYVYDGPIFGFGYAAPGDVAVQVQRALAQQGYYYGPIDGILGPGTRSAIQRYQINHGLAVTAAIDEQTLYTLGLT